MHKISVLIVDDEADAAVLSIRQIERGGHDVHWLRVENEEAMRQALAAQPWDIILTDHVMPHFDAFSALNVLQELALLTPMIVVSGRIGEEITVELMHAGAAHYVSKDNISRLSDAINHVLSDRKAHQQHIQQEQTRLAASRMEVAHTLAGGLSHEFNNLMVGVVTTSEILLQHDVLPEKRQRLLQMIYESGSRAVQVSRQLLAYAQGAKFNVSNITVNALLEQAQQRIQHLLHENITIICDAPSQNQYIQGDKAQLSQLIEGVLHNAIEAMPKGGEINITTFEHQQHEKSNTLNVGEYIGIKICDAGMGIEEEHLSHIFEPFYTTKFLGRGLGLAAAWGISQSHHGRIEVQSTVGEGSCFSILLPAQKEVESSQADSKKLPSFTEKKTILLVEDNEVVISVTSTLLRYWGHHILLAKDADQALEQIQENANNVELIILDLGLPGRSGGDILGQLREITPQVPILIVSGYPENDKVKVLLELSNTAFLRKPFLPVEMSDKIHQLFEDD